MNRFACRIAAVLCIATASVSAHAQLQLTCPINGNDLNAFFGDPDKILYGVKIRDWKPEYFDAVQRKNEECVTEAHYTEAQKNDSRMMLGNVLSLRGRYLQARDENVRRVEASHPASQAADNTNPPPIKQSESMKAQATPASDNSPQQLTADQQPVSPPEPATKLEAVPTDLASQQPPTSIREVPQQTATPNSARQVAPVESTTSAQPSVDHNAIEISSLQWKLIALALLANAVASIYLHTVGKLTIYRDYTDATFTGIAPIISIIVYFLLRFFEVSPNIATMVAMGIFAILLFFVIKVTAYNNRGVSVFFVMSIITKVSIVGMYYAIMALLIFARLSGSPRQQGETYATFEARQRREAHGNAAIMAVITAGLVALSVWVCKRAEFTPIDEYFSPKTIEE